MIELAYDLTDNDGKTILVGVPLGKINIYSIFTVKDKLH